MGKNRYGRIYHSDYSYINLRFPSVEARREFAEKFEAYHDSHDHDGEVPWFEGINASEANKAAVKDVDSVMIDGYYPHEIEDYHEDKHGGKWVNYKPPTCCVAPIISIDRTFVQSDTLTRHELSAIFTDIPDEEFASMLQSIQKDGFMDPVIRLIGTEVLDGWHRYSAAKELNLLRKLRFQQWNEKDEGDPAAFVYARNQHRRHQSAAKRAQITVLFNERYELGRNQYSDEGSPNGKPKTREELAKEAGVGKRTIDRAIVIEKEGESEAVIAGEKTTGEVIKSRDAAKLKKRKRQVLKDMWDTRIQAARDYTGDSDTDLNQYLSLNDLEKGFAENNESFADVFTSGMKRIDTAHGFQDFQDRAFETDEHGVAKVSIEDLDEESKAIGFYAGDIRQWQRPDWSPDTNWILPLIEAKKVERGHIAPRPEPEPEPDLKELREQVKAEMPKWKQRYKESGKKETELVSRASFSALIHVLRNWENASSASPEEGTATAEELKELLKHLKGDSYVFIYRLRDYIRETEDAPDNAAKRPATELPLQDALDEMKAEESDEDTSLTEIDNLPAVKNFLENLNSLVETDIYPIQRDDLSVAIHDIFLSDGDVYVTERQQLAILIDVAHSILVESDSTRF